MIVGGKADVEIRNSVAFLRHATTDLPAGRVSGFFEQSLVRGSALRFGTMSRNKGAWKQRRLETKVVHADISLHGAPIFVLYVRVSGTRRGGRRRNVAIQRSTQAAARISIRIRTLGGLVPAPDVVQRTIQFGWFGVLRI